MFARIHIAHCPVDPAGPEEVNRHLLKAASTGRKCLVSGVNASMFVRSHDEPEYLRDLEAMDLVTSDGFWLAQAGRLFGHRGIRHIAIVRLVFRLMESLAVEQGKVFLLGTKPETVKRAGENLEKRYPGLRVVGVRDGYFSREDETDIANEIDISGADFVLVGVSTPKREDWMIRNRTSFRAPVVIGIGGLLDIFAGDTKEGPDWLRNIGMMWAYRLLQEPGRMWKRYLVGNTRFAWLVIRGAFGRSRRTTNRQAVDV